MNNRLRPTLDRQEEEKPSRFRQMVSAVLLIGLGYGASKCDLLKDKPAEKPMKPKIELVGKPSAAGSVPSGDKPKGLVPALSADEMVSLAQCRLLVWSLDSRVTSESEIIKMADKIRSDKAGITADGIIDGFCIQDEGDKTRIRSLVAKGYKLQKLQKGADGSWWIYFESPMGEKGESEDFELNEKYVCKILTPKEAKELRQGQDCHRKGKEYEQTVKNGMGKALLDSIDIDKVGDTARLLGVADERRIKLLSEKLKSVKDLLNKDLSDPDTRKRLVCELNRLEWVQESFIEDEKKYSEFYTHSGNPLREFNQIMKAFMSAKGIDQYKEMKDCLPF